MTARMLGNRREAGLARGADAETTLGYPDRSTAIRCGKNKRYRTSPDISQLPEWVGKTGAGNAPDLCATAYLHHAARYSDP